MIDIGACQGQAKTIPGKAQGVRPDYGEHQLAPAMCDPNGRSCNRPLPSRTPKDDAGLGE